MKDMGKTDDTQLQSPQQPISTSPTHKATLTPTKQHPLKDLQKAKPKKSEFMDDSDDIEEDEDDDSDEQVITTMEHTNNDENRNILNDNTPDSTTDSTNLNFNPNQILIEIDNQLPHDKLEIAPTSIKKGNSNEPSKEMDVNENEDMDDDEMKTRNVPGKIVKRKKSSPISNNNNNSINVKNNNNRSGNLAKNNLSKSQTKLNESMTSSTDKLDGECLFE